MFYDIVCDIVDMLKKEGIDLSLCEFQFALGMAKRSLLENIA
jgi:hypothetical protein